MVEFKKQMETKIKGMELLIDTSSSKGLLHQRGEPRGSLFSGSLSPASLK